MTWPRPVLQVLEADSAVQVQVEPAQAAADQVQAAAPAASPAAQASPVHPVVAQVV